MATASVTPTTMTPCWPIEIKFIDRHAAVAETSDAVQRDARSSVHPLQTWPFMRGVRNSRIKLMKFGLQMLIDEQQSLQCSAHVTIASCDDLFDSNFSPFGSHTYPLHNHPLEYPSEIGAKFWDRWDNLMA